MADVVRSENDLPTLRVHMSSQGEAQSDQSIPVAIFEAMRGKGDARRVGSVPTRSLGLPDWMKASDTLPEERLRIPSDLAASICEELSRIDDHDPCFWLELPSPRGYLHLFPWERFLSPILGRPLIRLPYFKLRPEAPGTALHVVLAAGGAVRETPLCDIVKTLAETWMHSTTWTVTIDVFVQADASADTHRLLSSVPGVTVHDPPTGAPSPDYQVDPSSAAGRSRWFTWIGEQLTGRSVDVVHLVSDGIFLAGRGALAVPSFEPTLPGKTRSDAISATEVCRALDRVGAFSFVATSCPGNPSPAAMRDLSDVVAQSRPGVVAFHEFDEDRRGTELVAAQKMLFDGEPPGEPLPGAICWSHPSFVRFPEPPQLSKADATTNLLSDLTYSVLASADTPAWVAAGARALEGLHARALGADGFHIDPEVEVALHAVAKSFNDTVHNVISNNGEVSPHG
ncbi:hypothetical protein SAMN05216219_0937 [Mycetocola miduiensis]|uniref:Uncharacterized protein n=2 Tax=Mycetocola miduiensis TaxID=995034 RepID=A0A1I4ZMW3_9MICO|nr:hypothetical protein SAMN05216219_0937 [Mycetocola miduiensis]